MGSKSLNLKPGTPAACCWYHSKQDYVLLYNPFDCQVLDPHLPKVFDSARELKASHISAVARDKLPELNLTPLPNAIAIGVVWDRDWQYYYLPEDCAIANPLLPPVYDDLQQLRSFYPTALCEVNLKRSNLMLGKDTKAVGMMWRWLYKRFEFYYLPVDCETLDPNLPPAVEEIPLDLYMLRELGIFNREATEKMGKSGSQNYSILKRNWSYTIATYIFSKLSSNRFIICLNP